MSSLSFDCGKVKVVTEQTCYEYSTIWSLVRDWNFSVVWEVTFSEVQSEKDPNQSPQRLRVSSSKGHERHLPISKWRDLSYYNSPLFLIFMYWWRVSEHSKSQTSSWYGKSIYLNLNPVNEGSLYPEMTGQSCRQSRSPSRQRLSPYYPPFSLPKKGSHLSLFFFLLVY